MLEKFIQNTILAKTLGSLIAYLIIILGAVIGYYIAKFLINHCIKPLLKHSNSIFLQELADDIKSGLLGNVFAALILRIGSNFIDKHGNFYSNFIAFATNKLSMLYLFIVLLLILTNIIKAVNSYYEQKFANVVKTYSIKPYLNVLIFTLWIFGSVFIVAFFCNTSLTKIFAALGAASAVFLLIFKDTLLGIVSSIQASISNIARVGDRIAIDKYDLDGVVMDISISNVKIRGFDNLTTTIPTYMLTSEVVKNFRSIKEYGSKRVKRVIHVDINSIKILNSEEIRGFCSQSLFDRYISTQNTNRTITNIELFRLDFEDHIRNIPYIRKDQDILVYQLSPTPNGLPIEIYAYTNLTSFVEFEHLQSQIIAYGIVKMKRFGLAPFQNVSGAN